MIDVPPWLTGSIPFPSIEDWLADAALCVRQNLRARELPSVSCRWVVKRLELLPSEELIAELLRPEIFAFLTGNPQPDSWTELRDALEARTTKPRDGSLVWQRPTPQFAAVLRSQGRGSRSESCANANFLDSSAPSFVQYAAAIERALTLIGRVAPGFRAEIDSLVDCVVLVDEGASFRGASGLAFRGMVMLSPDSTWTDGTFAEELVHETTHALLDLISIREPLLTGQRAFEPLFTAPFRPDKRPLYGNFHALVVVSRLIHLFQSFERAGVEPGTIWRDKSLDYAQRSVESLATLKLHADLSPMAHRWLETLVDPTLTATLAMRAVPAS